MVIKTEITYLENEVRIKDLIKEEDVVITISHYVTIMRYGYYHIFFFDQVFDADFVFKISDFSLARIAEFLFYFQQLSFDQFISHVYISQQFFQVPDKFLQFIIFFLDLQALHTGKALQAQ